MRSIAFGIPTGVVALLTLVVCGCTSVRLNFFTGKTEPLRECLLDGSAREKVLVISVEGMIANHADFSLVAEHPGNLENIVAQLECAERDADIKAVLLKIDSPGGLVTASDILYNEINSFKQRTGRTVVVSMMDFATSGAYMAALPANLITAHPTTVTGSVGCVFLRPQFSGLMQKIGIGMDVSKSGENKDMGSPFRPATADEDKLFQGVIQKLNAKFMEALRKHRTIGEDDMRLIGTARVFLAEEALKLGMIDRICYLDEAIAQAKSLAGIPEDARVVVYRRKFYPNDNIYNTSTSRSEGGRISLVDMPALRSLGAVKGGFYYAWPGALAER
ncbi:MAG: signal peptide peptidase SppA [Victivallales bacterium]|nr:signal peptide peptidase SppA [Victivallales bacterium]